VFLIPGCWALVWTILAVVRQCVGVRRRAGVPASAARIDGEVCVRWRFSTGVERVGGFTDFAISPNDPRIRAAVAEASGNSGREASVAAIQADWKRKKEQMATSFASRPAALVDDTQKTVSVTDLGRRLGDDLRKALAR
jgi:hypothetical protein